MNIIITSIEELHIWTLDLLESLEKKDQAVIITLSGDLGTGKTTLVQELAKNLGITETVTSPTFVIQKEYLVKNHPWIQKLVHIDAYRLKNKEELEYLDWNNTINSPHTLIVIEWPEMVKGIILPHLIEIKISINEEHSRVIETNTL